MIDWVVITSKVPEVALVLVFVWFALRLVQHYSADSAKMMERWEGYLSEQNNKWQIFFTQRDEKFLTSVDELSIKQDATSQQLSADIQEQTLTMKEVARALTIQTEILRRIDQAANKE
jgi:hypothetical protein